LGLGCGVAIVLGDRLFAARQSAALGPGWGGFPHPQFPFSLIASATAGIGEEVFFRLFVLSLWALLLNLFLRRWQATRLALGIANLIAALAFAAGHLPGVILMLGVEVAYQPMVLAELFLLNGLVGLVAGERFIRDGLVAAVGVHFWADIVWHVLWPLA